MQLLDLLDKHITLWQLWFGLSPLPHLHYDKLLFQQSFRALTQPVLNYHINQSEYQDHLLDAVTTVQ